MHEVWRGGGGGQGGAGHEVHGAAKGAGRVAKEGGGAGHEVGHLPHRSACTHTHTDSDRPFPTMHILN